MKNASMAVAAGASILTANACADIAHFGFEELSTGRYTSIDVSDGPLSLHIEREQLQGIDVIATDYGVESWGKNALSGGDRHEGLPFVMTFSAPVTRVTFETGDFHKDSNQMTGRAYAGPNATGAVVDEVVEWYNGNLPGSVYLMSLEAPVGQAFQSITFQNTGVVWMWMFFDNVTATYVPTVASSVVVLAGLAAGGRTRRPGF